MTIYKGRTRGVDMPDLLHTVLIAEGYTEISSSPTLERVYKSPVEAGFESFYIRVDRSSLQPLYTLVGIYESYTPNEVSTQKGTFGVGYDDSLRWGVSGGDHRISVDYVFNVNGSRAILFVEGLKAEAGSHRDITYIGFPKRYSPEDKTNGSAGYASSLHTPHGAAWRSLRNRALSPLPYYTYDFYNPARSFGWGNKLFFSPIFVGLSNEGARGELDGLYIMERGDPSYEILHGDTFTQDGKTYLIMSPSAYGNCSLPDVYKDYLMEI